MNWRFIPVEVHSASMNMALDEACMEAVRNKLVPATIRLYRWKPAAVSIGNFQCLHDEVDLVACKKHRVDVVRRETGGGAVYHDTDGEVTYSIIGPVDVFPRDVIASYKEICSCLVDALAELGIKAEFRPINDITVAARKISGSAQTRKAGVLLQHGTLLLSVDPERMFTYLTPDKAKISDKPYVKSVKAAVAAVSEHVQTPRDAVEQALAAAFKRRYAAIDGSWTVAELQRAVELAKKFSSAAWSEMR
jgi:lipoate-protein ligase A